MPWELKPKLRNRFLSKKAITPWRGSDNQGNLYDEVQATFTMGEQEAFATVACESDRTIEKAHERLEIREYWTISDPAIVQYLDPEKRWKGLRGIGMVRAERRIEDESTKETRYFLLRFSSVKTCAYAVRSRLSH
jgi:hypothetical protein